MTKDDLPEYIIAAELESRGLTDGFTVQVGRFIEPRGANESVILVRCSGQFGGIDAGILHQINGSVTLFGAKAGSYSDLAIRASEITDSLATSSTFGRVSGVNPSSYHTGEMWTESDRPVIEISLQVYFN